MPNSWFQFKRFTVQQDRCAMKVTTDGCLFGAWVAKELSKEPSVKNILDIGAGTGLLSLMVAQQSMARIDAIEIDKKAYEQAVDNVNQSPWQEKVAVIYGNAIDTLQTLNKQYDAIISNPPFYENELQSGRQEKDMAHHATELTLNDLIQIIKSDVLKQEGKFYLLLPFKRQKEISTAFAKADLAVTNTLLVRQSTKHNFFRILLAGKKGTSTPPPITEELAIRNEHDKYTPEFIALLNGYYLHL